MKTLTIQIIDPKAIGMLEEMENHLLLKIQKIASQVVDVDWEKKYKGSIKLDSHELVEQQLNELRGSWD